MNHSIAHLFATPVYSQDTNFKFFEKEKEFINSLQYEEYERSGCMLSKDEYIFRHKNLNRIKIECEKHLRVYTEKVLCIKQNFYITNSWITKKERGQSHTWHTHPNSVFSGVFYMNDEGSDSNLNFRGKPQFSPFNLKYSHSEFNQFNSEKCGISVKNGTMIIFPSHLEHGVDQNLSYDNRIVIGFNSFVEGNFGEDYCARLTLGKRNI